MGFINLLSMAIGAVAGFAACVFWDKFNKTEEEKQSDFQCLFFTPKQVACSKRCSAPMGKPMDFPCNNCSMNALCAILGSAREELLICMYLITSDNISNTLIAASLRGVNVKIITDKFVCEDATGAGGKISQFKKAKIPVKVVRTAYMMHNKFAIVDNKTVVIGSINWTRQGFCGNYENVLVLHHSEVVQKYTEHFYLLWSMKS